MNDLSLNVPNITFTLPHRCVIIVVIVDHVVHVLVLLAPPPIEYGKCLVCVMLHIKGTLPIIKKIYKDRENYVILTT